MNARKSLEEKIKYAQKSKRSMKTSKSKTHRGAVIGGIIALLISFSLVFESWFLWKTHLTITGIMVVIIWTIIGIALGASYDKFIKKH